MWRPRSGGLFIYMHYQMVVIGHHGVGADIDSEDLNEPF